MTHAGRGWSTASKTMELISSGNSQIPVFTDVVLPSAYFGLYALMISGRSASSGAISAYGVGKGKTRDDHMEVSNQLYDGYARVQELRALAEIVGKGSLSGVDLKYLKYGDVFEQNFLKQGYDENRTIDDTLKLAWDTLSILPKNELTKIKVDYVEKYYNQKSEA